MLCPSTHSVDQLLPSDTMTVISADSPLEVLAGYMPGLPQLADPNYSPSTFDYLPRAQLAARCVRLACPAPLPWLPSWFGPTRMSDHGYMNQQGSTYLPSTGGLDKNIQRRRSQLPGHCCQGPVRPRVTSAGRPTARCKLVVCTASDWVLCCVAVCCAPCYPVLCCAEPCLLVAHGPK